MSRKTPADPGNGFNDIIGVALLAAALLLLVAQLSFDSHDIRFLFKAADKSSPFHNWIGVGGAYLAWMFFLPLGVAAYLVPPLLALFGAAYLLNFLGYLRQRLRWSLLWSAMLLVSITGLLYLMDNDAARESFHVKIGTLSAGGWLGFLTYGQTPNYNFGVSLLGTIGATIVYATLCLISLLFLTDFRLGDWLRGWFEKAEAAQGATAEETALDRRARELEKQARKLQEEVARSGLGADMQPVPEPTVRDLSVPSAKSARVKKASPTEASPEPAPAAEGEPAAPREAAAATTGDILGRKIGNRKIRGNQRRGTGKS